MYGVTYNCYYKHESEEMFGPLGGAEEEGTNISATSHNLDRLCEWIKEQDPDYEILFQDPLCSGGIVDEMGNIVAVVVDEEGCYCAFIVEDPDMPINLDA